MKKFNIYRNRKKKELIIKEVGLKLGDCVYVSAEFEGLKVEKRLLFFTLGSSKNPFIRFTDKENDCFLDVVLTEEIIEWIWENVGRPTTGEFYRFTKNYWANWMD